MYNLESSIVVSWNNTKVNGVIKVKLKGSEESKRYHIASTLTSRKSFVRFESQFIYFFYPKITRQYDD